MVSQTTPHLKSREMQLVLGWYASASFVNYWKEWFWPSGFQWSTLPFVYIEIEQERYLSPDYWEFTFILLGIGVVITCWKDQPPDPEGSGVPAALAAPDGSARSA